MPKKIAYHKKRNDYNNNQKSNNNTMMMALGGIAAAFIGYNTIRGELNRKATKIDTEREFVEDKKRQIALVSKILNKASNTRSSENKLRERFSVLGYSDLLIPRDKNVWKGILQNVLSNQFLLINFKSEKTQAEILSNISKIKSLEYDSLLERYDPNESDNSKFILKSEMLKQIRDAISVVSDSLQDVTTINEYIQSPIDILEPKFSNLLEAASRSTTGAIGEEVADEAYESGATEGEVEDTLSDDVQIYLQECASYAFAVGKDNLSNLTLEDIIDA